MKCWPYLLLGFALVFVIKYGIVGLNKWNATFHPDRFEGPMELQYFGKPLLGILS